MIGRTHGVHAEPITFGLKMALMYDEFGRALERLERARDIIAVGKISGAVGTYAHMNPRVEAYVCKKLGLQPDRISTQIVQRDRHAEFMSALALVGCSIDRWALEFRHLQRTEVLEAEEFFAEGQKGSSAMPHKRNPITCERLCGLARVLRGQCARGDGKRRALARTRHLAQQRRTHHFAGFDHVARLHARDADRTSWTSCSCIPSG